MSKKGEFSSKAIANRIFNSIANNNISIIEMLFKHEAILPLKDNILSILKRKLSKKRSYHRTKVYSATSISKQTLDTIANKHNLDPENMEVKIDKNLGPGMILQSSDLKIDATLKTMLEAKLEKILSNNQ